MNEVKQSLAGLGTLLGGAGGVQKYREQTHAGNQRESHRSTALYGANKIVLWCLADTRRCTTL